MEQVKQALQKRGFTVYTTKDGNEARELAVSLAPEGARCTIGGSATAQELGLETALRSAGHEVLWHWEVEPAARLALLRRAADSECYYLSANALLEDGRIVNIDGNGNRVAASLFGPQILVFIIGKNKITKGGIDDALARIRREACPKNARRLNLKTPCAITGVCTDCSSPDRMCKGVAILERPVGPMQAHVILVDESLGY